jgi:hypothetical protein
MRRQARQDEDEQEDATLAFSSSRKPAKASLIRGDKGDRRPFAFVSSL